MSYYRDPDDLPGGADPSVAGEPVAPPQPAAPLGQPPAPPAAPMPSGAPAVPIAQVMATAADEDAKARRKRTILIACVAVDFLIVLAVLAIFVF